MLQDLGACDGAFFGNMADEDDRNAGGFGKAKQLRRHLLDLAHAAGGGIHVLAIHRLHRVHYHQVRRHLLGLREDGSHIRFTVNEAVVAGAAQAVGPHFHLFDGLFTRDIQRFEFRPMKGQLQGKGRFADTRFSAHQHQGALHDTAAKKTVYLGRAQGNAVFLRGGHLFQRHRLAGTARHGHSRSLGASRHHFFLYHRVPLPAGGASAHPLGVLVAAVGTEPHGLGFFDRRCHSI